LDTSRNFALIFVNICAVDSFIRVTKTGLEASTRAFQRPGVISNSPQAIVNYPTAVSTDRLAAKPTFDNLN
jgi:hypothetical protein